MMIVGGKRVDGKYVIFENKATFDLLCRCHECLVGMA